MGIAIVDPVEQEIIVPTGLDFLDDLNGDLNVGARTVMAEPFPELGHLVNGIVAIVGCYQHIGIEEVKAVARNTESAANVRNVAILPRFGRF